MDVLVICFSGCFGDLISVLVDVLVICVGGCFGDLLVDVCDVSECFGICVNNYIGDLC